ncbi:MAG TPA: alpha/beta fold hydrolase [Gaiellaceae bacterium]|nr:alpha/beta fold hydrolase [Gaiellaceae bacterium]
MGADDRNGLPSLDARLLDLDGGSLRYFVGGEGPPVVLVHGLGGAASNWADVAPALARSFRVLVPDLPGHGLSTRLAGATTLNPYAERVAELAEAEGFAETALVGHSLGALVSLRLAVARPERVNALVLAGAAGIRSATREAERWLNVVAFLRPGRAYSRLRRRIARSSALRYAVFGYWAASDPLALSDDAVDGFLANVGTHLDTKTARRALVRDDPRLDFERVRCPSYVLWGARDHQVPIEDAFEYSRRLRAPLRVIADCGHLLIGERPDACVDAIESFLAPSA